MIPPLQKELHLINVSSSIPDGCISISSEPREPRPRKHRDGRTHEYTNPDDEYCNDTNRYIFKYRITIPMGIHESGLGIPFSHKYKITIPMGITNPCGEYRPHRNTK